MNLLRATSTAAAVFGLTLLAGCSAGDVELNGKLFDALGVNSKNTSTPKLAERRPLVLPPDAQRLPPPGAVPPPPQDASFPIDPERRKTMDAAALAKAQDDFCRDGNWKEKGFGQDDRARQGPAGPCTQKSIWSSVFGKSEASEPTDEGPAAPRSKR